MTQALIDNPIVAAIALDETTPTVVAASTDLARRLSAPVVPVHALTGDIRRVGTTRTMTAAEAADDIRRWFAQAVDEGVEVTEPVVEAEEPGWLVTRRAARLGAQMIVTGGGEVRTVRQWMVGSVAERVVRSARQPVWMSRGTEPAPGRPILCPVDLSAQSRLGFAAALRMARAFDAPLRVLTVVPQGHPIVFDAETLTDELDRLDEERAEALRLLLSGHDLDGVEVRVEVVAGRPVAQILAASHEAHLIVVGGSSFDRLRPGTFGGLTERVVRGAWCSVLTVHDWDPDREERERRLRHVAELKIQAQSLLADGRPVLAERFLRAAIADAPLNAALFDLLEESLTAQKKPDAADEARAAAESIRDSIG